MCTGYEEFAIMTEDQDPTRGNELMAIMMEGRKSVAQNEEREIRALGHEEA